jgi:hypothetical protein
MRENKPEAEEQVVVSYKGFNPDLKCRDFQYEIGGTYEHQGNVEACASGFHACEYPLHVFRYYKPSQSRFAVVEQRGQISRHEDDSKVASSHLTVKAEIDIAGLIKAAVKYTMDRCTPAESANSDKTNTVVKAEGRNKSATASGDSGAATASGDSGAATASGNSGAATASGDSGAATASGYSGAATASGDSGAATASGRNGKAKGKEGCAMFLVYRDENWKIVHAKAAIVGQEGIKPNTFYSLNENGEFVEAE